MNASSSTKEISKKMESNRNNNNMRRRSRRYSPYTSSSDSMTNTNEKQQREEAVRLGVELSLLVSETMLMLSEDIDSVLVFCLKLLKNSGHRDFNGPRRDVVAADVAVKPSDFEHCNQTINKIKEEKASLLLLSKDDDIVSEEEEIKAKAVHVWKSLFETTKRREDMRVSMVGLIQMFKPIFNQVRASVSSRLIQSLHI
ncbi:unnamed protein product [Cochlearia groenlandica]